LRDRKENSFPVFTHNITPTTNTAISTHKRERKRRRKMAEKQEKPPTAAPAKPTITLPPRPSMETLFTGGLSPGAMTLVSSFFTDTPYPESDYPSFSQLLAGAMASPIARPAFFTDNLIPNNNNTNTNTNTNPNTNTNTNTTTTAIPSSKEDGINSNSNLGFKPSRPTNLVVARSPLFTVPPGLSPSGLLDSPAFFSPRVILCFFSLFVFRSVDLGFVYCNASLLR
jgi:hypothetical protein